MGGVENVGNMREEWGKIDPRICAGDHDSLLYESGTPLPNQESENHQTYQKNNVGEYLLRGLGSELDALKSRSWQQTNKNPPVAQPELLCFRTWAPS